MSVDPRTPRAVVRPGLAVVWLAVASSTVLGAAGIAAVRSLAGAAVGVAVLELIWQCDLRPRAAWNGTGAVVLRPFGARATVRWTDVRCVWVCGGLVMIKTRDGGTVRFGFGLRGAHRAGAIRTSIRAARTAPDRSPLPHLPDAGRPWWAYLTLGLNLVGAWLAIAPA